MDNTQFAYLLGMITGKGTIVRDNRETEIRIEIPHKNLIIEGMETELSVKASILDIKQILDPLIGSNIEVSSKKNITTLSFRKDNRDFLIREINRHFGNLISCKDFRIPKEIFTSSEDIKKEFLRGLADVTAHVRSSNNYMCKKGTPCFNHRVYIEIPVNWFLVIDIANLLMHLNIPVHNINWGHPNTRDPELKDYNKGREDAWFREHQIKIFAEEFEKIGFKIIHKNRALEKLSDENRKNWDIYVYGKISSAKTKQKKIEWQEKLGKIEIVHHRYYWEIIEKTKPKPKHPMEDDYKIPDIIRGKHFNSWKEIAKELGYPQK